MHIEQILTLIVFLIIFIKIIFIISSIGHLIFFNKSYVIDAKFVYWEKRSEFLFTILMSILLIIIFNPWRKQKIVVTNEMRLLFSIYGIILIITAHWGLFFKEPDWFKIISDAIKL